MKNWPKAEKIPMGRIIEEFVKELSNINCPPTGSS
jgi:hypothetical protein